MPAAPFGPVRVDRAAGLSAGLTEGRWRRREMRRRHKAGQLVLDTNGNGRRDEYVEPDQPLDPTKDKRIAAAFYGIAVSPLDGSIWGSVLGFPGAVVRLDPGENPPATALAEIFEPPLPGYSP